MSLTTKWDGSILTPTISENERTTLLGVFKASKGIQTYVPLPSIYNKLLPVVSLYKVPAEFNARPDLIATELYQSADLWWVVLWVNDIIDPFGRPNTGEVLKVIDIQDMKDMLK